MVEVFAIKFMVRVQTKNLTDSLFNAYKVNLFLAQVVIQLES